MFCCSCFSCCCCCCCCCYVFLVEPTFSTVRWGGFFVLFWFRFVFGWLKSWFSNRPQVVQFGVAIRHGVVPLALASSLSLSLSFCRSLSVEQLSLRCVCRGGAGKGSGMRCDQRDCETWIVRSTASPPIIYTGELLQYRQQAYGYHLTKTIGFCVLFVNVTHRLEIVMRQLHNPVRQVARRTRVPICGLVGVCVCVFFY